MKPRDQQNLLREIFADAGMDAVREDTLARGLAAARRRRRRRQIFHAATAAAAPALALAIGLLIRPAAPQFASSATAAAQKEIPNHEIKSISDSELLALFPDRAVGLIGPPGRQQLVFFDEPAGGSAWR